MAPGHIPFTRPPRSGCFEGHTTFVSFCDYPSALGNSRPATKPEKHCNSSSNSAVHSSPQPCTSGPELPASPRRRRGLWERLPWIRAWQRLGVQLWPAGARVSRLLRARSRSARSSRREVGEGPGSSWPPVLLPCSLPGA